MSGYEAVWRALESLIREFRKKGIEVPPFVMDDLRSAKTLIEVLKMDTTAEKTAERAETYLKNVEAYLLSIAEEKLGPEEATKWARKIDEAWKTLPGLREEEMRFAVGMPRDQKWVRIRIEEPLKKEEIVRMAEEEGLSWRVDEKKGYLTLYGEDERIKNLIKRIAEQMKAK